MTALSLITCEVQAVTSSQAVALQKIAALCASDLAQPIILKRAVLRRSDPTARILLKLPVELASTQDLVWCLACRLACFCPQARVSVLIQAETTFVQPRSVVTRAQESKRSA